MSSIIIKCPEDGPDSWGIIELQGEIESRVGGHLETKFAGDLHYTKKEGIPVLIIGHHILHGKAVKLEKPLAVLEKQSSVDDNGDKNIKYIVKAVVRQKLIFKVRPKPIIAISKT